MPIGGVAIGHWTDADAGTGCTVVIPPPGTVGAIDAVGRINPNECVLCLRCQVVMNDAGTCPVLKRRARGAPAPVPTPKEAT